MVASVATVAVVTAASATPAMAQDNDNNQTAQILTTIAILLPATTTTYLIERLLRRITDKGIDKAFALRYVEHNAVALQSDITLGGGATVDDLALLVGVAPGDVGQFGQNLRARRGQLSRLIAERHIDPEAMEIFVELITEARPKDGASAPQALAR